MAIRTVPVITKLTAEFSAQPFEFGLAQRLSVLDPTMPPHFPCHITGSAAGLICSHGTECVAIPWNVLREIWEVANPKLVATPAPKNKEVTPALKAALAEAAKLPPTP